MPVIGQAAYRRASRDTEGAGRRGGHALSRGAHDHCGLNEAFGRPWNVRNTQFGPGLLLIATVLFGLSHLYQIGATRLDPFTMVGATLGAVFYGVIRERSGSVLGSAVTHGMTNAGLEVYRRVFGGR